MDHQTTLEKVVRHMFKQGKPAQNQFGECVYRGPEGTMCAVGCLIPDDQYRPEMDLSTNLLEEPLGTSVSSVRKRFPDVPFFAQMTNYDEEFLSKLQNIHDDIDYTWDSTKIMKDAITIVFGDHFNLEFMDELSFVHR